jgi:long-chain acyl-CoA synthetase
VVGDRKRFVSALIVPEFEKLEAYARSRQLAFRDRDELVRDARIVDFMREEIGRVTPLLASYERIKKFALLGRDFELEKGEITPSLKVRRAIVEGKYLDLIESMYVEEAGDSRNGG